MPGGLGVLEKWRIGDGERITQLRRLRYKIYSVPMRVIYEPIHSIGIIMSCMIKHSFYVPHDWIGLVRLTDLKVERRSDLMVEIKELVKFLANHHQSIVLVLR